jgi:phosphocarrier protein HPr
MLHEEIVIVNKLGLHARPSAKLTQVATQFKSEVWLTKKGRRINGKSIMGVMMLAAGKGTALLVETNGADEIEAMVAIRDLIGSGFGEDLG